MTIESCMARSAARPSQVCTIVGSLESCLDAIWYVPCAGPAQLCSVSQPLCSDCMCAYRGRICTVTRTLRSAHVPTSGDPGWSPYLDIPWGRPAHGQAIGTPPVPVWGLQMKPYCLAARHVKRSGFAHHGPCISKQVPGPVACRSSYQNLA